MATSSRKTTDLERLTQPGGKVMPDDATIPVLTERLTLPSLDLDISLPHPPPPMVAPVTPSPPPPIAALLMPTPATAAPEPSLRPAVRPAPPPSTLFASVASVAPVFSPSLPPPPTAIDWDRIETQLRESLLRDLQPQLAAELERQVHERLQPTLVRALTALISDLRPALDSTVRETIVRAISAEVARQRESLK